MRALLLLWLVFTAPGSRPEADGAEAALELFSASALAAAPASNGDQFDRLLSEPGGDASSRLDELYRRTKSADQRLWIIHALGVRLKEQADSSAIDTLLTAAQDENPDLRGPALRSLTGFTALPKTELGEGLLARLDAAAKGGAEHKAGAVRDGAGDLQRALMNFRDPSTRTTPAPPEGPPDSGGPTLIGLLRWLWLLLFPAIIGGWIALGLPIFDAGDPEGVAARAAWGILRRQRLFLSAAAFLWLCLAAILAGYGFDALVRVMSEPPYPPSSGWVRAYFAAGLAVFLPGALLGAGLSDRPEGSAAAACLSAMPGALLLWALIFAFFAPLEVFYRLFIKTPRRSERAADEPAAAFDLVFGVLEQGSLRAGYLVSAVMARERLGLVPALRLSRELAVPEGALGGRALGLGAFDPRFTLLCAAPVLAFFCALIAKGQSVSWAVSLPIVLLGCSAWSWAVLAGVLYAVLQTLEGAAAAAFYLRAATGRVLEEVEAAP